jgi:rhodanese-related sulfurtransferase
VRAPSISVEELRERLAEGGTVLDVRTPEEFTARHIPGALSIPIDELAARKGELAARPRPIYVICEHGVRSRFAVQFLAASAVAGVVDVRAGMSAWGGAVEP